jgi:hypothetical protein
MGSCCGNEAPTPPDPQATARAQTGTNVSTAIANAYLGNVNQQTPDGTLTYSPSSTYSWTDPTTQQTYNIPTFTATQQLSDTGLALKRTQDTTKQQLANIGQEQSARIGNMLNTPLQTTGYGPQAADSATISNIPKALTSFDPGNPLQSSLGAQAPIRYGLGPTGQQIATGFGDAGDVTRSYGPADNFSADRQRVEESLMARMNPSLQQEESRVQQQLADQGIRYGSQAYNDAMRTYQQQANDARFGAISQAGQEQARMMDMAAQRAGFQNAAQQQAYNQAQGRGQFYNAAQGQLFQQNASDAAFQNAAQQQGYQQNLGMGEFYNQAQNQLFQQNAAEAAFANAGLAQQTGQAQSAFNAAQAARNSWLQEQYAGRNQPLNEISALMSGSQVSQPNFVNAPSTQIPTTDYAGITQQGFQNQMGIYNSNNQMMGNIIGGALGGAAGLIRSDRREKDDIDRIATVFAANTDGVRKKLPIYQYSYKDDPASLRHIGPMAQDVERIEPRAVEEHEGTKYIRTREAMGAILRAA